MSIPLSAAAQQRLRDLVIGVSLGNLCVLRRWYYVEQLQANSLDYFRTHPPTNTLLYATLLTAASLSAIFWLVATLVRATGNRWLLSAARAGFLALLIVPLETIRRYWNYQSGHADWVSNLSLVALDGVLLAGIVAVLRGHVRILHAAERVASLMILFVPIFLVYFAGMHSEMEPRAAYLQRPSLPLLPARPGSFDKARGNRPAPRVIWLLFDELDQRLTFDQRQPGVELPELDRLRSESFAGTHALQTAGWTMLAVPSMLSGEIFEHSESADASTLLVQSAGSHALVSWRDQPNVFRKARELGANAAVVGWHHPYCRVLGDSLARCFDEVGGMATDALARETYAAEQGFWKSVGLTFASRWQSFAGLLDPGSHPAEHALDGYMQKRQQQEYFRIRDRAYQQAADPRIDFLFVHFPAPHLFAIYDAKRKDFTLSDKTTYFDNLALVDRTVGELRRTLEQAGLWESTSILITSDHGLRYELWHGGLNWTPEFDRLLEGGQSPTVPFILKLAGETKSAVYEPPFSNVVGGDLSLAVLRGEVSTSAQAAAWIEGHGDLQHVTAER
ncbi:MAG TPA: alkaline phosphatase family protein [Bryobacteraceae bacterium]|nr:alkaline phosphatase family protein [Bryobacteraceae bacterium]